MNLRRNHIPSTPGVPPISNGVSGLNDMTGFDGLYKLPLQRSVGLS